MDARKDSENDADEHHANDNNHNTKTNTKTTPKTTLKTTKETMILMLMMTTITTMINMPSVAPEDVRQRRSGFGFPKSKPRNPMLRSGCSYSNIQPPVQNKDFFNDFQLNHNELLTSISIYFCKWKRTSKVKNKPYISHNIHNPCFFNTSPPLFLVVEPSS